jgi:hypothetical protein
MVRECGDEDQRRVLVDGGERDADVDRFDREDRESCEGDRE